MRRAADARAPHNLKPLIPLVPSPHACRPHSPSPASMIIDETSLSFWAGLRPPAISWECSLQRPRTSRRSPSRRAPRRSVPVIFVILALNFRAMAARPA